MLTNKLQEIEQYKTKIAELEKELVNERKQKLASLHSDLGYGSRAELIAALQGLESKPRRGKGSAGAAKKPRGKRARITPEMRDQIKQALLAGKKGSDVAREFKISVPTVQNIKKEIGLVKAQA
jgi:hypothetical protein